MRLSEHLYAIKQCLDKKPETDLKPQPVGIHFSAKDHLGPRDLKFQILDFVHLHPHFIKAKENRLRVEKWWIDSLRCPAPLGLNILN